MILRSISSFVFDTSLDIKQGWFLFYLATERHRKHGKGFIGGWWRSALAYQA
jgi:hypothetical protein